METLTQNNYNKFAANINNGIGWISEEYVFESWNNMFGQELNDEELSLLINNLEANGLIEND